MRHIRTNHRRGSAVCGLVATSVLMAAGPTFRADYRFTRTTHPRRCSATPTGKSRTARLSHAGRGRRLAARERQGVPGPADLREREVRGGLQGRLPHARGEDARRRQKGILMSLTEGDLAPYAVKIDAAGKEIAARRCLRRLAARAGGGGGGGGGWRRRRRSTAPAARAGGAPPAAAPAASRGPGGCGQRSYGAHDGPDGRA